MKKSAVIASVLSLIFLTTPAHAESVESEYSSTTIQPGMARENLDASGALPTPEPRDAQGRTIHEPREHGEHSERGLEGESVIIVIGALIIAVGLAYGIGRRNGHKQSQPRPTDSE